MLELLVNSMKQNPIVLIGLSKRRLGAHTLTSVSKKTYYLPLSTYVAIEFTTIKLQRLMARNVKEGWNLDIHIQRCAASVASFSSKKRNSMRYCYSLGLC